MIENGEIKGRRYAAVLRIGKPVLFLILAPAHAVFFRHGSGADQHGLARIRMGVSTHRPGIRSGG